MPMAEAESTPAKETRTPREAITFHEGYDALRTRLLLGGDNINPEKKDIAPVRQEEIPPMAKRDYGIFEHASEYERARYWQNKEGDHLQTWINDTKNALQSTKDFFQNDDSGKRWKELFAHLGLNTEDPTAENITTYYRKYFSAEKDSTAVKQFVSDVLSFYTTGDAGKQSLDYASLKQDRAGIQWLANMFGDKSAEIVAQLTDAEARLIVEPAPLLAKANNNPSPSEKALLTFLWEKGRDAAGHPANLATAPPGKNNDDEETEYLNWPQEAADALFDYNSGKVKEDASVDLSNKFPAFVSRIENAVQQDDERFRGEKPILVLSDLTLAMIEKIAQSSNDKEGELAFSIRGIDLLNHNGGHVLISAYAAPAMDFYSHKTTTVNLVPSVELEQSEKLARATNLEAYLLNKTNIKHGNLLGVYHIHPENLGEAEKAKESERDINQATEHVKNDPNNAPRYWGVITRANGQLHTKFMWAYKNAASREIINEEIQVIKESEL